MATVLIVDDAAFMRSSIKNMLGKHGYEVVGEAANGKIGVEKYQELSPDIPSSAESHVRHPLCS
jgi:two-component system chemotaxis response regulator CheY